MSKDTQDFGWLDKALQTLWNRASLHQKQTGRTAEYEIAAAKTAIQAHITAMVHPSTSRGYMLGFEAGKREQTKQHQADLLRARIDVFKAVLREDPLFEPIWQAIKEWDLSRNSGVGYAHATGTDVQTILDAIKPIIQADKEAAVREAAEWLLEQPSDIEGYTRDSNIRALIPHKWDLSATPITHPQAGEGEEK